MSPNSSNEPMSFSMLAQKRLMDFKIVNASLKQIDVRFKVWIHYVLH